MIPKALPAPRAVWWRSGDTTIERMRRAERRERHLRQRYEVDEIARAMRSLLARDAGADTIGACLPEIPTALPR